MEQLPAAVPVTQQQAHEAVGRDDDVNDEVRRVVMGRWRSSLDSGLRAALACSIVGFVSLYAPPELRRHITFPAFSYVVTVIIVTDATLGTVLRGAVAALHGSLMGAAPSVLALWLAHRTGAAESVPVTSSLVALTTFAVALPESVGPVAKRIALGQIIIIYVARFRQGERPTLGFALLHPAIVVMCTALGVAAALLAVLVPWPRLATSETRDKSRAYKVLAAERVRVMADAFCYCFEEQAAACRRRRCIAGWMSEAKRLASASASLLHRISSIREDVRWERALHKASAGLCKWARPADQEEMEAPLGAMQMSLAMMNPDAGTGMFQDNIGELVTEIRDQTRLVLFTPNSRTNSIRRINGKEALLMLTSRGRGRGRGYDEQQMAPLLFLFSLYHLHHITVSFFRICNSDNSNGKQAKGAGQQLEKEQPPQTTRQHRCLQNTVVTQSRLMAAAKCGFSLGLAVLLGLLFSNDHGFWSGLIVATTMAAGRDSTWALGIARAHGTALGSVYGVLCCLLISQRHLLTMNLRFLALLPWMVLATFLKRSRAYGPAGGVAAALSAVIIMGRRYDEPPMAFTIARLVETFIGISCVVLADLVFHPGGRPSVQAKVQLIRCIAALADCFAPPPPPQDSHSHQSLRRVRQQLALLRKCMAEARSEPTYLWLPPFPAAAYDKLEGSVSRMVQLLRIFVQARAALVSCDLDLDAGGDIEDFSRLVSTSLKHCLLHVTSCSPLSSSSVQDETSQGHDNNDDLEAGHGVKCSTSCSCCDEVEAMTPEEVVGSFLAHGTEALLLKEEDDKKEAAEGLDVCCLASMGLCMGEIIKEALRLEAHILDLSS